MAEAAWIFSDVGFQHETPVGHPERPERLKAIRGAFEAAGLNPPMVEPEMATREDLLRAHSSKHIDAIEKHCSEKLRYPDADTHMGPGSWDAALYAAGSAIAACKAVLEKRYDRVFSAMRPPGHHAERERAMGFCLFGSAAIAAKWLVAEGHAERVAIFDWDVHHGNGTQDITYDDAEIYYISIHQWPLYPKTGHPRERGAHNTNLNLIVEPDAPAKTWMDLVQHRVVKELEKFEPDFLIISAGFDAHERDPLADQHLTTQNFADMTRMVKHIADGRIVSILEGGYDLEALGESAVAHFRALGED